MTTPRVFFSYRRDDSLDATGRLHDRLQLLFPPDLFFRDIDDLKGGESFRARLDRELTAESCALVLAIIGPTWDSSDNMRRLKKTSDLVRRELIAAMERKIPVVPVLVSNRTVFPSGRRLPEPVRAAIAERNAMTVHSDGDFSNDVARLANRIAEITDVAAEDFGQLVRNCRRMGLVMAKPTFQDDNFGRTAIEEAGELIVVQNDGRSWIDTNRERLMERAQRRGRHTTIVLLHPRSTFLEVLIRKSSKSMAQQLGELHRSFEILQPYIASGAIVLKGHFLFNPHTLIMTERFAVIDQYFLCESGDLPRFKYAVAERGLYRRIRSDFEELIRRHSADISAADFR